jgi:hypothetical protein
VAQHDEPEATGRLQRASARVADLVLITAAAFGTVLSFGSGCTDLNSAGSVAVALGFSLGAGGVAGLLEHWVIRPERIQVFGVAALVFVAALIAVALFTTTAQGLSCG